MAHKQVTIWSCDNPDCGGQSETKSDFSQMKIALPTGAQGRTKPKDLEVLLHYCAGVAACAVAAADHWLWKNTPKNKRG